MLANKDELALLETRLATGKPIGDSLAVDIPAGGALYPLGTAEARRQDLG